MTDIRKYYVYVLLDPRREGVFKYGKWKFNHEPFYVGKGSGDRALCHFRAFVNKNVVHMKYNALKTKRLEHIYKETGKEPIICYKRTNLTETEAYDLEEMLISKIRRSQYGGPLLNLSTGGGVATDVERKPLSKRTKQKISESIKRTYEARGPAFRDSQDAKRSETWKEKLKCPDAKAKSAAQCIAASRTGWEGKNAETNREIAAAKANAINERYKNLTPIEKAKRTAHARIGYSLSRFKGSDKLKPKLKEILMSFVKNSRHRNPVRFRADFKSLCGEHGLSS